MHVNSFHFYIVHSEIPGAVMPTITLPPECETTIGAMLRSLFSKFVDLLGKFTEEIEEKITCGDVTLTRIIRYVQNYTMSEENLQASQNLEDLIRKVDTHYDFLDFELILAMAEQFSSADLLQKLQNHSKAATKFRESQPVEILAKQLKNIYGPYSNVTSGPVAYIDLNSAWNKVNIRGLYILINCFFPNSDRKSLMKHIKITSASVHIEYYMTESSFQKVVADVEEKISFMHLIGIYRFKVNGYVILPGRHENVNFTFESGLLNAAWIGNNQVVQLLLDLGVNVDCTNEQGSTALMLATECGYEPIVQTLLSSGLNVNIQDSYGWTALMLASHNGHFQLAELLLNKQANVNHTANNGATALMIASQNGHFQVAGLLLNKQANVNLKEADGWTALMLASQNGHFQIAELLLNKQANVNHTANNGATALMNASQNGYVQVTELLLNKQANVNHTANNGATALMLASKNGHFQVTDLLLNKQANVNHTANNGWTALMLASHNGNFEVMELLLNKQANVNNHIANNGATALMLASQNGHFQAVELLLNKAANVNHTAKNGSTALMLASQNGHIQVTELLLNKQATVNHTANNGWTALMLASQNGHFQVTELLLNKQADINVTNNNGWTALMLASQNGHFQIVELLLDANASPIVTDSYGTEISSLLVAVYNNSPDTVDVLLWTFEFPTDHIMRAFVLACYCGHSTLINTLITDLPQTKLLIPCVKGDLAAVTSIIELNPDTPLVYGLTPLMIATSCEHIELIDALIQAGADVNTCNDYGNNALDIAEGTFNKQQDVIQLLLVNGAVHNIPTDTVIDELTQNIPPHQLQHQSIEETDSSSTTLEKIQSFIKSFLTPIMK